MDLKKLAKALLFPHIAIMTVLVPVSAVLLIAFDGFSDPQSVGAIASYVISFYTLTVWCVRMPAMIKAFKTLKSESKLLQKWENDTRLRVNVSLYGSMALNIAYAALNLGLGVSHSTFWFYSLAGYYVSLAHMRFFLVRYTGKHRAGENKLAELAKYRTCGIAFLIMNLALTLIIFFMVYWNRTFVHHEITTITMAAYTFTALTLAIVNIVRYRKYDSPVYSASKAINLASACVSMLTLESTMLTTFGGDTTDIATRRIFLAVSGAAVSVFIITMAIYMIVQGTKEIRFLKAKKEFSDGK